MVQTVSTPIVSVCHSTGNQNVREVLAAIHEADLACTFATSVAWSSTGPTLPAPIERIVQRRRFDHGGQTTVVSSPAPEVIRQLLKRVPVTGARKLTSTDGRLGSDWVAKRLDRWASQRVTGEVDAVYGYIAQSREQFRTAEIRGIPRVLEVHHVHAAYAHRALEAALARYPLWLGSSSERFKRQIEYQDAEIATATRIVVPSAQVEASVLERFPDAATSRVPYGCPVAGAARDPRRHEGGGQLKVLIVSRLDLLKGVPDIIASGIADISGIQVTVLGPRPAFVPRDLERFLSKVNYLGSVSRAEVLRQMRDSDLLLQASLVEGRSLAVCEAQGVGLPAVVTPGTGADDLVSEGGGLVIPEGSPSEIEVAIRSINDNRGLLEPMSVAARAAAEASSWKLFRAQISALLLEVVH